MAGKKIILTVTNDLTYDQRMQKICRSLAGAGYSVELVGRERDKSLPFANEPFKQTRLKCIFNKGKLFYIEYNLRLLFYLLFCSFDAACAIDLDTISPVYIIGKLKGAKLIYDAHEYFPEVPEVIKRPGVKKVWELVERTFVPKFDAAYTVSGGLAELFENKYGKKFEVIMNTPLFEPLPIRNPKPQIRNILYQGALNEGRGLKHLLEAMVDIDGKLTLVGEGDLSADVRQWVKELQLEDKVEMKGFVVPEKLKDITRQADIGIHVSVNAGLSYYYSLGNKFFDYIQAGIPQVCTIFPEYKKINDQYEVALFVKDSSTVEIKNAIQRLQADSELYWRLQKNCEVCSRELNWQVEEKKLLAIYGYLLR